MSIWHMTHMTWRGQELLCSFDPFHLTWKTVFGCLQRKNVCVVCHFLECDCLSFKKVNEMSHMVHMMI